MKIKLVWQILAVTITSFILIAVVATPLAAEEPLDNSEYIYCCQRNQSSWNRGQYSRRYNLNKVETINAKVVSVDTYVSRRGVSQGIHILVKTGKEMVDVHIAPSWYLKERDFAIAPEDKIVITGSRIDINGVPAIVAREIKKGNETLTLRDANGFPLWRGDGWKQ